MSKIDTDRLIQQSGQVFARLGKDLSATTSAIAAADIILRAADDLIGWDAGYLILYDPEQGGRPRPLLTVDTINGEHVQISDAAPAKPSENMLKAIREDGYLSLYEKQFDVDPSQSFGNKTHRTLSQLFVPVKSGRRIIGVFSIQSYRPHAYEQASLEALKALSNHCAGALARIWAQELVGSLSERRNILYKASQEISASLDIEQLYRTIHKAVEQIMPCDDFIIDEYDEATNEIVPSYIVEAPRKRVTDAKRYYADHGLSGTIVHNGNSVIFNSVEERNASGIDFELTGPEDKTQSIVAVPLLLHGKVTGMISAQSYKENSYTRDDQELLEMLAPHAAIAMENARLFARVREIASIDPLTGILNRRKFYELAEREFARTERYHEPLSVIAMDADDFKKINDQFGHKVGDIVLQIMANQLKSSLREVDILCRHGGEEFVIVLPNTGLKQAAQIAERGRELVEKADLRKARSFLETAAGSRFNFEALRVTLSVGVAEYSPSCLTLDILIDRADRAMYAAKKNGKNRVETWVGSM